MEVIQGIINLLNSIGTGVIANYIFTNICKLLDSGSTGNKSTSKYPTPFESQLGGGILVMEI